VSRRDQTEGHAAPKPGKNAPPGPYASGYKFPDPQPAAAHNSGGHPGGDDYTARTWAIALLQRLNAPITHQNVHAIVAWEAGEGGHWQNSATYNPLDTTQDAPGASSMNSVGVKAYSSWDEGLNATVQTLQNGRYQPILDALHNGHEASLVTQAVVNSPWGTRHINLSADYSSYGHGGTSGGTGGPVASTTKGGGGKAGDYFSNEISGEYGYLSAYLDDPEIGPILRQAAKNDWSQQKLLSALEKTNWWQTTSQSARQAQALQSTDPATYKQTWQQQRAQVASLATSMGLHLGGDRLDKIATTAMWSGWTDLQLERSLSHEFNYNPDKAYKGTAGTTIQKLRSMSSQYLVPITDGQMQHWTRQVLAGSTTADDFSGYLADQAKTLFPWMAKAIDAGTTPGQYLDPYRSAAASTLELDPARVDFSQAKWRNLFETIDPKTGDRSERGLANAMTLMRTDPRYGFDYTQGANNDAANFAQGLAQEFGYVG
jgi:hypothetical protein